MGAGAGVETAGQGRAAADVGTRSPTAGRVGWVPLLLCGLLGVPPLAAQDAPAPDSVSVTEPRVACFRGRPLPECRSFWLIEMQLLTPIAQTEAFIDREFGPDRTRVFDEFVLEWNLGHMVNLDGGRTAVGGVFVLGTQANGIFAGLRARGRRWISDQLSVESSIGWTRVDASHLLGYRDGPLDADGVSVDLRLNLRDQGAFFLRWDAVPLGGFDNEFGSFAGGTQHALMTGVGTGSIPALVTTGGLLVGFAALLAILVSAGAS